MYSKKKLLELTGDVADAVAHIQEQVFNDDAEAFEEYYTAYGALFSYLKSDGEETGSIPYDDIHKLLDKYFIAYKLWSTEDIECELARLGYEPSDENVATVLNHMWVRGLSECTDSDWEIINQGIAYAKDELKKEDK